MIIVTFFRTGGPTASHLQELQVPVVRPEVCQAAFKRFKSVVIDDRVICAGYAKGGYDACKVSKSPWHYGLFFCIALFINYLLSRICRGTAGAHWCIQNTKHFTLLVLYRLVTGAQSLEFPVYIRGLRRSLILSRLIWINGDRVFFLDKKKLRYLTLTWTRVAQLTINFKSWPGHTL